MVQTPAWPPRSLPRLHIASPLDENVEVELDGGQSNYLANVLRLGEWFLETARAKTRLTPFARLMAEAPAA